VAADELEMIRLRINVLGAPILRAPEKPWLARLGIVFARERDVSGLFSFAYLSCTFQLWADGFTPAYYYEFAIFAYLSGTNCERPIHPFESGEEGVAHNDRFCMLNRPGFCWMSGWDRVIIGLKERALKRNLEIGRLWDGDRYRPIGVEMNQPRVSQIILDRIQCETRRNCWRNGRKPTFRYSKPQDRIGRRISRAISITGVPKRFV
jgi:hypothetical protein